MFNYRTIGMCATAFLASIALSSAIFAKSQVQAKTPVADEKAVRKSLWRDFLEKSTTGLGPLMVEVRDGEPLPPPLPGKPDVARLALTMGREVQIFGNTTVLVRPPSGGDSASQETIQLFRWISGLSAQDRADLFGKGLTASRIEPRMIPMIGSLFGTVASDLRQGMANNPFLVRINFAVRADYTSAKLGPLRRSFHLIPPVGGFVVATPNDPQRSLIAPIPPLPTASPTGDHIDLPQGLLMEMAPFLKEVAAPLKVRLVIDDRLKEDWLFVRGAVGVKDFTMSMSALTKIEPAHPAADPSTQRAFLDNMLKDFLPGALT